MSAFLHQAVTLSDIPRHKDLSQDNASPVKPHDRNVSTVGFIFVLEHVRFNLAFS